MVKIAIDARFYGSGHTGLGRYTTNVLKYLPKHLSAHSLQVLLRKDQFDRFKEDKNVQKILADIPHYSFAEQIRLPLLLNNLNPGLFYTFHLNTPIFAKIPTIVTIHDLIKSHFTGADTTTRAPWLYVLKRLGYNQVIKRTLSKASDIIVPTNTVKNDILAMFTTVKPELIHPIAEAPDELFRAVPKGQSTKLALPARYLLFVGNAYPHKNLSVLLSAMQQLTDLDLVIVAKRTPFLERTLAPYTHDRIHIFPNVGDIELMELYKRAEMLVTPSLMEGYGLPGLEALMVGTPVVASNIPTYREVYGGSVTYFDPRSVSGLVTAIKQVFKLDKSQPLTFERTWDEVARDIAEVIHARCTHL